MITQRCQTQGREAVRLARCLRLPEYNFAYHRKSAYKSGIK